ncbi:hypothetical protein [Steroidobacter agaridevorans]|uniref:hypothetical protein n=1 Tax=Steroidobacter agaridevorans TaxID=2695856 RepID=UPI0013797D8C|nr:hypothetical protein [Steroidobacter agaridevorans]
MLLRSRQIVVVHDIFPLIVLTNFPAFSFSLGALVGILRILPGAFLPTLFEVLHLGAIDPDGPRATAASSYHLDCFINDTFHVPMFLSELATDSVVVSVHSTFIEIEIERFANV